MGEERYLHSDDKDDVELGRLRMQSSIYDPTTARHLETMGISRGGVCLEIGAGAGSIAQWLSMLSIDVAGDPSSAFFAAACRASNDFVRRRGIADPYFGRRVRSMVEELGFVDVGQEGWTQVTRGGDPMARFHAEGWRVMLRAGIITREQYESLLPRFTDQSY